MKDSLLRKIALILCLCLLSSVLLTACGETPISPPDEEKEETPQEIHLKAEKNMKEAISYSLQMKIAYRDETFTLSSDMVERMTSDNENPDAFCYHATENTHFSCEALDIDSVTISTEGFQNGFMYLSVKDNDEAEKRFYGAITAEEYHAWIAHKIDKATEGGNVDQLVSKPEDISQYNCEKLDGKYRLTMSGLGEDNLKNGVLFSPIFVIRNYQETLSVKREVTDAVITAVIDENYRFESVEISYVFVSDAKTDPPEMTMTLTFSDWNTATVEPIDFDSFGTQVADLRAFIAMNEFYNQFALKESGSFTAEAKTTTKIASETTTVQETDRVSFANKDGAYTYSIHAKVNKTSVTISYENGKQTVSDGKNTQVSDMTDMEAKSFVMTICNPLALSVSSFTSFTSYISNMYYVRFDQFVLDIYRDAFEAQGMTVKSLSGDAIMTVTDDFEVESITISINVGIIYQGYHGSVVIKNKVTPDNGSRTIKHK